MNDVIRQQMKDYLVRNGVMAKHIASHIGVSDSMISLFKKGKKNLGKEKTEKLITFLAERGVNA